LAVTALFVGRRQRKKRDVELASTNPRRQSIF
jgi:hypothetical protein